MNQQKRAFFYGLACCYLASSSFLRNVIFEACVCYFLSKFFFSPNDSPSKTVKNVFEM